MAIHGTGYRPLEYRPTSLLRRMWAISALEYKSLFRRRLGVMVFIACLAPALFNLVIVCIQMGLFQFSMPEGDVQVVVSRLDPKSIDFYLTSVVGEFPSFLVFLVLTSLVSCRAIAKDRESSALEIYWTRGITPRDYFVAKWLGSFLLLGTVFVGGPLLNWLLGVAFAPDEEFFAVTSVFVPRVLLGLVIFTAGLTFVAVLFSAIAGTANLASILWLFLLLGTAAVGRVLARVFGGEWWFKAIDPWDALKRVAEWVSGYVPRQNYDPMLALLSVSAVILVLLFLAARRLRGEEAIG